jgi:quercetin dioxygenase-like cupin family protein
MGVIHKFQGDPDNFDWDGVVPQGYDSPDIKGATVRWLISEKEKAPYFAMRYFEIEPGGWTDLGHHAHDHGVIILKGKGKVLLGEKETEISFGDVVYVSPNEIHQFKNIGDEPFGFICVIPNKDMLSKVKAEGSRRL